VLAAIKNKVLSFVQAYPQYLQALYEKTKGCALSGAEIAFVVAALLTFTFTIDTCVASYFNYTK